MEGNGYYLPLRYRRRYTPYEFDLKMSQNEERMSRLGKIIDQDIFYSLISQRKTPSVTDGPNYVVENKKDYDPLKYNFQANNLNDKKEIAPKNKLIEISTNSFKIPRSPRYDNINQTKRFKEQDKEINNNRRYGNNNQNDRYMDEPINSYNKRKNNFDEYMNQNQYPNIMDNENNNSRNKNSMLLDDYGYDKGNGNQRYNDYEDPRRFNNNFRSQEISKINNYEMPRSPINYEEDEGNYMNNRYKKSFRDRMNDIDLNDMKINNEQKYLNTNNQRYGNVTNSRRGFYNSQLNFPPKEEEEY